jgi:hypothetical protein
VNAQYAAELQRTLIRLDLYLEPYLNLKLFIAITFYVGSHDLRGKTWEIKDAIYFRNAFISLLKL